MAKFTLSIEEDYDFRLIGLCSHAKDYRLSWFLNENLGISLQKEKNLEMKKKETDYSFSFYSYADEEDRMEYYLIGNKNLNIFLIPEEKQIDFFLQLKGSFTKNKVIEVTKRLKGIPIVLKAYEVEVEALKSKKNLIF